MGSCMSRFRADQVCVFDCLFADDIIPGTHTEAECTRMGGEPQRGSGKSGTSVLIDLLYKSAVCAIGALPATVFLDQSFWRTQALTNARTAHEDVAARGVRLAATAALHYAADMCDVRSA